METVNQRNLYGSHSRFFVIERKLLYKNSHVAQSPTKLAHFSFVYKEYSECQVVFGCPHLYNVGTVYGCVSLLLFKLRKI
jgi:hypothetical protein